MPFNFSLVFAQAPDTLWTKTYGGIEYDWGFSVQQTDDGGYIIGGAIYSFGSISGDVWLLKTDANGDTVWTKIYGGTGSDWGKCVQQTTDSGYIIGGVTSSFGADSNNIWLLKTDANGDTVWTKIYGGAGTDEGQCVQQTTDSGYIIVGWTESFGAGAWDVWLLKTDADGDTLWTKTYGGIFVDYGYSVQQTNDGGYIIVGWTKSFGAGDYDVYLVKTDVDGDTLWTKTYGGTGSDGGRCVQQTADSGYIIVGSTESFGAGDDVYLVKTDADGDTLWTKTYGGTGWDYGSSVRQTTDGGYIIVGWTFPSDNVYLVKTDAGGDTLWTKTYGGTGWDEGLSVQQTADSGYIIVGWTESFGAGGTDIWLLKIAPETGVAEQVEKLVKEYHTDPTIFSGPLILPADKNCKVFDITGREVDANQLAPGIYFIQVDNEIVTKVVKIK